MEVYTGTKTMKGKNNDARYFVVPFSTFCIVVHIICPLVGCHGDGVPAPFAGSECDKRPERYPVRRRLEGSLSRLQIGERMQKFSHTVLVQQYCTLQ